MKQKLCRFFGAAMLIAVAGMIVAGCGGEDEETTAATTQAQTTTTDAMAGEQTLTIEMGDFYFKPKNATAKAGQVTIEAPNDGSVEHELVLFKTNVDPAELPTDSSGGVDEEKLDQMAEEVGEIADVEPGQTGSGEFNLTPGKYVMFCNLPGHYAQGMYGSLTVSK